MLETYFTNRRKYAIVMRNFIEFTFCVFRHLYELAKTKIILNFFLRSL